MAESLSKVEFIVMGKPIPEGSMCAGRGGHMYHQNDKELKAYRKAIANEADKYYEEMHSHNDDMGYQLYVLFFVPRPKSVKRLLPTTRPDTDKYVRSVGDALTSNPKYKIKGFWDDDSQVVDILARKRYVNEKHPEPCTIIMIKKVLRPTNTIENINMDVDEEQFFEKHE
jgi:Holliday junction resolvase RusA-like endonuclease